MELVTSVVGGEAPGDGTALSIALGLQGGDTLLQVLHADHPTRQTATGKDTDLDLGHVQPTAMDAACNETRRAARCAEPRRARRLHTRQRPYACSGSPGQGECIPPADRLHRPAIGCSGRSRSWCDGPSFRHAASRKAVRRSKRDWRYPAAHIRNQSAQDGPAPWPRQAAHPPLGRPVVRRSTPLDHEGRPPLRRDPGHLPSARRTQLLQLGCTTVRVARACVRFFEHLADGFRRDGLHEAQFDRFSR